MPRQRIKDEPVCFRPTLRDRARIELVAARLGVGLAEYLEYAVMLNVKEALQERPPTTAELDFREPAADSVRFDATATQGTASQDDGEDAGRRVP